MTVGPEAKLWKSLRPIMLERGCYLTRIENRFGGGIPDVDVVSNHGAFKVELKISEKNFRVSINHMQIAYNTGFNFAGGLSFILVKNLWPERLDSLLQVCDHKSEGNVITKTKGRGPRSRVREPRSEDIDDLLPFGDFGKREPRSRPRYHLYIGSRASELSGSGLSGSVGDFVSGDLGEVTGAMLDMTLAHWRGALAVWEKAPRI